MATDFVACVIRNYGGGGGYWQVLADEVHVPLNAATVTTDPVTGLIRVDYGTTFTLVHSLIVGPDETLAVQGITAGASVNRDHCKIGLRRAGAILDPTVVGLESTANLWIFGVFGV